MNQKQSWDLCRLIRTLTYFDVLPVISSLPGVKQMILGKQAIAQPKALNPQTGTILVAGATGGVGKRVLQRLQQKNYPVRALVRSIERARSILGDDVEFYEGDITIPDSLKPDLIANVTAVICCTGTRIQPVEGDTPDREKYYQGVKFYEPEVAESTPEAVEYKGIQNLIQLAKQSLLDTPYFPIFNFRNTNSNLPAMWGALDDVVMGGVSESGLAQEGEKAVFSGNVSTENNGGFTSVRTRNFEPNLDLSGYEGIYLRVKGDGNRYKFFLRCDNRWDGIGYAYSFDTEKDTWIDVYVPFAELTPVFRAKTMDDAPDFNAAAIDSMQLMLSKFEYDKALNPHFQPGTFRLEVEQIAAYGGEATPQWITISSAGVTRPGRSDLDLSQEPPAVQMNEQLGGLLTWKLAGENAIRESGLRYTIIRPCALTEETESESLQLEQGDTLKGQVSRETIAQLCVELLQSPEAVNKTFEVARTTTSNSALNWQQQLLNLEGK
ncbi:NADH:ubiquinone oxidoreductase complex I intermediate-associated protein 30 [Halothece sp. PCC 7418]|uniref:CIA30 family protein n=1 Tax=Halothece sp. (strain PCC 7418) TaxID=65093 RepID=UPI0002A07168|nr:CIA30 family protein [Halothece sp. PCC 7418]AFZ42325.1 NADH:ubiquinone oxidoreductase complex I intermediate-associated protein 30 [Halothece sp. PCC 7418]